MVKLYLNESEYPTAFLTHPAINPANRDVQEFIENLLIEVLNNKNPKLNIEKVAYSDLKVEYGLVQHRSGVVIREDKSRKQVLAYIFLSPENDTSRNTIVAQTIFPDLINIMETYIESPSFTLLNHPIYFINMIDKELTASSIRRDFALLTACGFQYVELFEHSAINTRNIPLGINTFVEEYITNLGLEAKFFQLNDANKILKITFPIVDLLNAEQNAFNGSKEKFYWTEVLPISVIAANNGFEIDYSEFENFINNFESVFSQTSDKMDRCKTLLEYLKKLQHKMNYKYEL